MPRRVEFKTVCDRGCGRDAHEPDNLHRPICKICLDEIKSGRVVSRQGLLIDLPDEIRRYDRDGQVKVAIYIYKGRPNHVDHTEAPEVTWSQFVKHLLYEKDFCGNWRIWVYRCPEDNGGVAGVCMESNCSGTADRVLVKIKGGI